MKKVVKQNEEGFYYVSTEVEGKDIALVAVCVLLLGLAIIKELVK